MARIIHGDCRTALRMLEEKSVHCCVTSPPYFGLRSYLPDGVKPRNDCPEWVIKKLESIGVFPVDHIM